MQQQPDQRGFALLEILVAMGIFAFAMVGIAAMFPIAIRMQQITNDRLVAQQMENNIQVLMTTRKYPSPATADPDFPGLADWMKTNGDTDGELYVVSAITHDPIPGHWTADDRTFPSSHTVPEPRHRPYVWIPLIQDADPTVDQQNLRAHVLICRYPKEDLAFTTDRDDIDVAPPLPEVRIETLTTPASGTSFEFDNTWTGGELKLKKGDLFLDEFGRVYKTLDATATGVTTNVSVLRGGSDGSQRPDRIFFTFNDFAESRRSPTLAVILVEGFAEAPQP